MIYVYWYLAVGAVSLALIVLFHKLAKKKDGSQNEGLSDYRAERKLLWFRILNDVIGPALVSVFILPFWPAIVFFKIKQLIVGEPEKLSFEEPEFSVTREDLLAKTSVSEIEEREMVSDPLDAVPHLPFGHLNLAWNKFLESAQPFDTIWTFAARWTQWGQTELWQGYVVLRGEEIGPHFVTMRTDFEEEEQPSSDNHKSCNFNLPSFLRKQAD